MRDVGRHGPGAPKYYLTLYTGMPQVRLDRRLNGTQAEVDHLPPAADVRAARSHLRAYLRRIGVPGRIIREVCGWLHRGGRCWVTPCPSAAWRAAMALRGAP